MTSLVIIVAEDLPIGGLESHALSMISHFTSRPDYRVTVITKSGRPGGKAFAEEIIRETGADVQGILDGLDYPSSRDRVLALVKPGSVVFLNSPLPYRLLADLRTLARPAAVIIRSGGNDLGLPWSTFVDGSPVSQAYRALSLRLKGTRLKARKVRDKIEAINNHADLLITNSDFSTRRSIELGVNPTKIVSITGGVPLEHFQPREHAPRDELRILALGRLVRFKGLDYTLKAFAYYRERSDLESRLTIVGAGPVEGRLKKLAKSLGLAPWVDFKGMVPYAEVPGYYQQSDVFLHLPVLDFGPGRDGFAHTETMGRVLCEASAAGVPIVAASVGGIPEIISSEENGFLVEEKDFVAAGEKLLLLGDARLRKRMGAEGRKAAEALFGWDRVFDRYEELFKRTKSRQGAMAWADQGDEEAPAQVKRSALRTEGRLAAAASKMSWRMWRAVRGSEW